MLREIAGRYRIEKRLGSGAWATVYGALDTGAIERRVAIKVFRLPPLGDPAAAEEHARFRQGARAAGRLSHPNVVSVFDYGEDDETAWIVMELVEGDTLKDVMDAGERLDTALIARIMEQILDALGYTHSRGVVHRDIKPANIMLTRDRVVKITDFGVARLEDASITHAGTVLGSPSYMAPEQFRGDPVDHRADLWAAGVILYQLLTGERPFEGSVTSVMQKALYVEPALPSQTRAAVPVQFDAVTTRALAKRPEARFASAAEFAEAVRSAAAQEARSGVRRPIHDKDATIVVTPEDATLLQRRAPARRRRGWLLPLGLGGASAVLAAATILLLVDPGGTPDPSGARAGVERPAPPTVSPFERGPRAPAAPAGPEPLLPRAEETPRPPSEPDRPQQPRQAEQLPPPPAVPAVPAPPPPQLAPPQPGPVLAPPPPDLRRLAVTAGAAFQCGVVSATIVADRIVFRGAAPRAETLAAQRAILAAGLPAQAAQLQAVEEFDAGFCPVLLPLEESMAVADAPQLALLGPNPLPEGQVLRLQVTMPNWPAHLALFALMPNGEAGQLAATERRRARESLQLSEPGWEVTAPFGTELLLAIATERPLFPRRRRPERVEALAAALGPALRTLREGGGRVSAQVIAVRTVPR